MLRSINKGLEQILRITAAILLFGLFLIIFMQVILRYFFNTGFKWIDGISVMGFIWLAMVGSALGVRGNSLARVTILESKYNGREGLFFWVQKLSTLLFMGVLCYRDDKPIVLYDVCEFTEGQIISDQELREMGDKFVIHPLGSILLEARQLNNYYAEYKKKGTTKDLFLQDKLEKRQVYQDILGYSEYMQLRETYKAR